MGLFDDECGDVIVIIRDGFAVGDEVGKRVGMGIRFTLFELDFELKL